MAHLKLCPEAGKQTALSDYGAIVSAQISHRGCMKFKVLQLQGCRQVSLTNYPQAKSLIPPIGRASSNNSSFKSFFCCRISQLSCHVYYLVPDFSHSSLRGLLWPTLFSFLDDFPVIHYLTPGTRGSVSISALWPRAQMEGYYMSITVWAMWAFEGWH